MLFTVCYILRKGDDMTVETKTCSIDVVLFDFGGVLAERGFEEGLRAIAIRNGLNEESFHALVLDLIHATGYLTGHSDERTFWQTIRDKTKIRDDDTTLRNEILSRFILRPWMFDIVKKLRESGINVVILSDQTNWLDELNERHDFFKLFDVVFNSYHLGKSKVDPAHFTDTISRLGSTPEKLLFIDDTGAHCETARKAGIHAIQFVDRESFIKAMGCFFPFL
jgi:putative hydrolase of the HAD superfamily